MHNDELRLSILRHAESTTSQRSLASDLGFSVGKVNYVLKALIGKGLIKAENFASNTNKRQYKYLLTKQGIEERIALTEKFIERKKREYEELQVELHRSVKYRDTFNQGVK